MSDILFLKQAISEGKLKDEPNFVDYMKTWTLQKGHPVLNVNKINKTHIQVEQNRFVLDSTVAISSLQE
jgi:hypothetical protein